MRYASLKLTHFKFTITRIMIILFIIFMQNLYKKFHDKKKSIILTSNRILNSLINQNIEFDYQKFRFKCSDSTVKTILFTITKSNI